MTTEELIQHYKAVRHRLFNPVRPVEVKQPKPEVKVIEVKPKEKERLTLDKILEVISEHYNIGVKDLKTRSRQIKYVRPRQVAVFVTRRLTTLSYSQIARRLYGRDHTTMIHAFRVVELRRQTDNQLDADIAAIEDRLRADCT